MADIANGADVVDALDAAVDEIDADIEANDGYGFTGEAVAPGRRTDGRGHGINHVVPWRWQSGGAGASFFKSSTTSTPPRMSMWSR